MHGSSSSSVSHRNPARPQSLLLAYINGTQNPIPADQTDSDPSYFQSLTNRRIARRTRRTRRAGNTSRSSMRRAWTQPDLPAFLDQVPRRARTPNVNPHHSFASPSSTSLSASFASVHHDTYNSTLANITNTTISNITNQAVISPVIIPQNGTFNPVEVASISIIILLVVSLFLYHCRKASEIESNLKKNGRNVVFRRSKIRRHHSFSRSASFASNLESVVEEPDIFDTRLADKKREMEQKINGESPPFLEPWYKWLQMDSPKNNPQSLNKKHQSESDLNETDLEHGKIETCTEQRNNRQILNGHKIEFEPPIKSYLITVSKKHTGDKEDRVQRSLSFDSYF